MKEKHLSLILKAATVAVSLVIASPLAAADVRFDSGWKEQGFLKLWSNDYRPSGTSLDVISDGTVSLFWRGIEDVGPGKTSATWSWSVSETVPATDLSQKGGDDRNLALYFVYVDAETAANLTSNTARKLLRNPATRALVYVWGGDHARGAILRSPYDPRLSQKILRPVGTGQFSERVDLEADYKAGFGAEPGVLVGLGVLADSDDTDARIRGRISDIMLR
jgi:hypothetical protein